MSKESRKKFLLHACCAPCGIAIIDELKQTYDVVVFFYNPNIYPEEEYLKRKAEVVKVCSEWNVSMINGDYEPVKWGEAVKGLEEEPEGGARCSKCFLLRLSRTAELAYDRGCDFFGTTLTMGRQKKASVINPLGLALGKKYGVTFYEEDWKKKGRWERGRAMVRDRGVYLQNYCGCKYSMKNKEFY